MLDFFLFLNIGEDWEKILRDSISTLTTTRGAEKSSAIRFLLGCAVFAIRLAVLVVHTSTFFIVEMSSRVLPNAWVDFNNMLIHTSPNTLRCYNKTGLLIFFADFYMVWFILWKCLRVRMLSYVYVLLKLITIASPLVYLVPADRLPHWVLAAIIVILESVVALRGIYCWTYGIDWENAPNTIYRNWSKHYRYRRPTTNRTLLCEVCRTAYPIVKILILCGYFCYDSKLAQARLEEPHLPTRGGVTADFSYINALIEQDSVVNLRYGVLFLLALSSLSAYSIILAGWSSNSKYAFIGALRSAAQMISYEVAISLVILPIVILSGSLNLTMITHMQSVTTWFLLPLFPISILFLIAMLAETNRTPFDLPEAEAELVAGYNVDYSSLPFAMFFLAEYCNMILMASVFCKLFIGAVICQALEAFAAVDLALKAAVIWFFFVVVRAAFPRYRYDQLMDIGWKVFLPIAGGFLVFDFGVLLLFDALPVTGELPDSATAHVAVAGVCFAPHLRTTPLDLRETLEIMRAPAYTPNPYSYQACEDFLNSLVALEYKYSYAVYRKRITMADAAKDFARTYDPSEKMRLRAEADLYRLQHGPYDPQAGARLVRHFFGVRDAPQVVPVKEVVVEPVVPAVPDLPTPYWVDFLSWLDAHPNHGLLFMLIGFGLVLFIGDAFQNQPAPFK